MAGIITFPHAGRVEAVGAWRANRTSGHTLVVREVQGIRAVVNIAGCVPNVRRVEPRSNPYDAVNDEIERLSTVCRNVQGQARLFCVDDRGGPVGLVGVHLRHATVASEEPSPAERAGVRLRAVILAAAVDDEVAVAIDAGGDAVELDGCQVGVEAAPALVIRVGGVGQLEDAAVVAIEQVAAGVEDVGVLVGVRPVAGGVGGNVCPAVTAVEAFQRSPFKGDGALSMNQGLSPCLVTS